MIVIENESYPSRVGKRIKELRENRKLSMEEVSNILNISKKRISEIEMGAEDCSLGIIYKLSRYMGVTIKDILSV